jgi:DNA-binding NarL/FixJ family response regulator
MIKLAIIEDTKSIREVLQVFFEEQAEFTTKVVAPTAEDFFLSKNIEELELVLCDIGLPGKSGMETTWTIKKKYPHIHVVMFTVFEDKDKIFQSLQAGASGYLLKNTPLSKVKQGLLEVIEGGASISPQIAKKVIDYFNIPKLEPQHEKINKLSAREIDVITQVQKGYTNRIIAENLFISIDTVKYHIKNIYSKLQINSRHELQKIFHQSYKP